MNLIVLMSQCPSDEVILDNYHKNYFSVSPSSIPRGLLVYLKFNHIKLYSR